MSEHTNTPRYGFLIDVSYCIDCRTCMVACSVENEVPMDSTRIWIKETGVTGTYPDLKRYTAPYHCMHCIDPSCVSACTVGALQRNDDGHRHLRSGHLHRLSLLLVCLSVRRPQL